MHYVKSYPQKSQYPTTKTPKNSYTSVMQLSLYKYGVLINTLTHQKIN